jgi:hypothetical protein
MSAQEKEHHFNPSDLSNDQVDRIGFAVMGFLQKNAVMTMKPMTIEQTASFLGGISTDTIHRLRREGVIQPVYIGDLSIPYYMPEEILKAFKKRRQKKI